MNHKLVTTILTLIITFTCFSQSHRVTGYVKEKKSKLPIPFASVWIRGTYDGIATDDNGYFSLTVNHGDTLHISSLGYIDHEIIVTKSIANTTVTLKSNATNLKEINVKPDEDYAKVLFRRIIEHKEENIAEIKKNASLRNVNTTTIYLAIDSSRQTKHLIKDLEEVSILGKDSSIRYSPIFLSEEANEITNGETEILYTRKDGIFPRLNQTIEGIITQYLVVDIDIYENNIYIFDKTFVSPISNNARLYYNIYLNDSTIINNKKYYQFTYAPKNKFAALFTGGFMVCSEKYAIKDVDIYFMPNADINFVNGFKANIAYNECANNNLYMNHQNLSINLSVFGNEKADSSYASERVNDISSGNWLLNKRSYFTNDKALDKIDAHHWKNHDDFEIDSTEALQYQMVDQIKDQPKIKAIDAIGSAVLTSYFNFNYVDLGPVFDIYSTNAIEGNRFSIPLRTNETLFKHFTIGGFLGYGTKSNVLKFGANVGWEPLKNDKLVIRLSYANDYSLVSQDKFLAFIKKNPNSKGNGNFIAALTTQERDPYLKEEKRIELRTELNAEKSFGLLFSPYYSRNISTPAIRFIHDGIDYNDYSNYGVLLNWRIAFNQYYDEEYFARIYYLTQTPIINISMDFGKISLPGSNETFGVYSQIHGSIQGIYNVGIFKMRYMFNGGYLHGNAPYDLLDMPVGSRSWGFAKYRYNLLYQAAFAHNAYTNMHLELSGGGIILNKIPYLRRLKWREMISVKSHYGTRGEGYKKVFELPSPYHNEMRYPYAELGLGISNIFKVLRVEYVRQVGDYYLEDNVAAKDGIRFRAELSF